MEPIQIITEAVCSHFKVTPEQIRTRCRKRTVIEPRMFVMYYTRKYTNLSLSEIGLHFPGMKPSSVMDHSSVLHAVRTCKNLIEWNGYKRADIVMDRLIQSQLALMDNDWMDRVAQL